MQVKVEFDYTTYDGKRKKEIKEYEAYNVEEVIKRIISFYDKASIISITTSEYIPKRINVNLIPIDECNKKNHS